MEKDQIRIVPSAGVLAQPMEFSAIATPSLSGTLTLTTHSILPNIDVIYVCYF